jgi:TRAP-type mannitol/chloroaromatic compound transport system permease small subunit
MMFITCLIVVARYVFNLGSIALQETVMYMHGMVFMLGIGYTLKHQGHVRVDIFYEKLSIRKKALIDLFGTLVFLLPIGLFILIASLNYVSFSWSLSESSAQPGGLPGVFLLKTLIPLMAFLLVLQGLAEIGRSIILLTKANDQA